MKILVTGSEGSLAQMVIPRLLEAGHRVVGCDNFARYGPVRRRREYEFRAGDLADTSAVASLFSRHRGFGAVFHLAALVYGVVGFHEKPADVIVDNNLMTMNLLKRGRAKVGRFVYLSSSMVYERCARLPHREGDVEGSAVMSTSYGLSKYVGERVVRAFHEQYGTPFVIWRPFNIITPFETAEREGYSHVFSDLVEKIVVRREAPVKLLGDGRQVRCFTSIYDVARAVADLSLSAKTANQTFNLGNPEPVTIRALARRIAVKARELGLLPSGYRLRLCGRPIYGDDVRRRIPDVSKAKRRLGWQAKIKLDESLDIYLRRRFKL